MEEEEEDGGRGGRWRKRRKRRRGGRGEEEEEEEEEEERVRHSKFAAIQTSNSAQPNVYVYTPTTIARSFTNLFER